jgi:hypothetical protein
MITLAMNNFGCGSITLKDYQSAAICVLNGKITVDLTNPDYMAATRLELDLPADFAMPKSAMSTAILVSNVPIDRYGTVLHCWIENNKLCIEKITEWDSFGNYEIHINSAFVTRGYHGDDFLKVTNTLTILNPGNLYHFSDYHYVETNDYVYFTAMFTDFPRYSVNGQGPFTLQLSGFAPDVSGEIPLVVHGNVIDASKKGSRLTVGSFENGNLTFSYPEGAGNMGGSNSFFNFFAVRN